MAVIGTFSKTQEGYAGTIRTMTINVRAKLVPNDKNGNENAPDFRLIAGGAELGAAWRQDAKSEDAKPYLSVQLDDPSFAEPVRAAFFENERDRSGILVWGRLRDPSRERPICTLPMQNLRVIPRGALPVRPRQAGP